jgi:hypothetical protein
MPFMLALAPAVSTLGLSMHDPFPTLVTAIPAECAVAFPAPNHKDG